MLLQGPKRFLDQHSKTSALALCQAVQEYLSRALQATAKGMSSELPGPPTQLDWVAIAGAPCLRPTTLTSALECQRLWKFIGAYCVTHVYVALLSRPDVALLQRTARMSGSWRRSHHRLTTRAQT